MTRLIDADALANAIVSVYGEDGLTEDASLIYGLLLNAPTIDAEPVVRCKDCKWYNNQHLCVQLSRFGSIEPLADFYCGFGERREP